MKTKIKLSLIVGIATLSLFFQNCAEKVDFNSSEELASQNDDLNTEVPVVQDPVVKYPKLKIEPLPCIAGNICEVKITALEPVAKEVSSYWKTNDTAWETQPSFYAKPGKHYVSAAGQFKIEAGKSSTVIKITSINWENRTDLVMTMSIPLTLNQCRFGAEATPCSLFF